MTAALAARLLETLAFEPLDYARVGDYARQRAGLSARRGEPVRGRLALSTLSIAAHA